MKTISLKNMLAMVLLLLLASVCEQSTPAQLTDALLKASAECKVGKINDLLKEGADVNGAGTQDLPLRLAAVNGHIKCVKLLLKAGADPARTIRVDNPGAQTLVFRTVVSVQAAMITLKRAKETPPNLVHLMHPAEKELLKKGIKVETYEEIIRILEEAEKNLGNKEIK